jgi:hypothetical protein
LKVIGIAAAGQAPDQVYLPVIVKCAVANPEMGETSTNGLPVRIV